MKEINDNNYNSFIENDNVILVIGANWCGACKHLRTLINKYEEENLNPLYSFGYLDSDANIPKIEEKIGESEYVPRIIFYKNGGIISEKIGGIRDFDDLIKLIEKKFQK